MLGKKEAEHAEEDVNVIYFSIGFCVSNIKHIIAPYKTPLNEKDTGVNCRILFPHEH